MDWTITTIILLALFALLVFLVWKNSKDRKKMEQQMNQDYRKSKDEEGDIEDTKT